MNRPLMDMGHPDFAFLHRLADAAGSASLPYFRAQTAIDNKSAEGGFDPVTIADREAEQAMRDLIAAEFPDHGVLGEEFAAVTGNGRFEWVIDPIDGTRSFIAGVPLWGTIIGLRQNGAPCLGLFSQPFTGERLWGDGDVAWYRGPDGDRRVTARDNWTLGDAILMTTTPALFTDADDAERYAALEREVRLSRYGADGYAYGLVAQGTIDLVVECGLAPYDIVGLIPIIEGAGGCVTNWSGGPADNGGRVIAAANRRLHEAALEVLNQ